MMLRPGTNDDGRPRSSAYVLPVPVASSRLSMAGFVRLPSRELRERADGQDDLLDAGLRRQRGGALELDPVALAVVERDRVHAVVAAQRVEQARGGVLPAREADDGRAGAHAGYELDAVTAIPPRELNRTVTVSATGSSAATRSSRMTVARCSWKMPSSRNVSR